MPSKKVRIPFDAEFEIRDSEASNFLTFDQRIVNGYIQQIGERKLLRRRPGVTSYTFGTQPPAGVATGIYTGKHDTTLFAGVDNKIYRDGTLVRTLGSTPDVIFFCETGSHTGATSKYLYNAIQNGVSIEFGTIDIFTNVGTPITLSGGVSAVGRPVFMDGYNFVLDTAGNIRNSAINDPTTWPSFGTISNNLRSAGVTLIRALNYVIALGSSDMCAFYDAAQINASPLAFDTTHSRSIGCVGASTVTDLAGGLAWVAAAAGERGMNAFFIAYMPADGVDIQPLSTSDVNALLQAQYQRTSVSASFFASGRCVTSKGQHWYLLDLPSATPANAFTLAYHLEGKRWGYWTSALTGAQGLFPGKFTSDSPTNQTGSILATTTFPGNAGGPLLVTVDTAPYADSVGAVSANIALDWQGANLDFGTTDSKTFESAEVIADRTAGASGSLTYSDDDYQTSSGGRTIALDINHPVARDLGSAHRRSFRFVENTQKNVRLEALELTVSDGGR